MAAPQPNGRSFATVWRKSSTYMRLHRRAVADHDVAATIETAFRKVRTLWRLFVGKKDSTNLTDTALGSTAATKIILSASRTYPTTDQFRYAFQIKAKQITETIGLTCHSAFTHLAVAASVYSLWNGRPGAFLIPFCCTIFVTETFVFAGKRLFERYEPTRHTVDIAYKWAGTIALFQGLTWGSLPVALLPGATSDQRTLLVAIITGLIGGVFVFGSITRITVLYLMPLTGGCLLGLLIDHQPISSLLAALLMIYAVFVMTSVLRMNSMAARRILDRLRVEDQRETIGLLLNDFEENTSDWLWETDSFGRLIHVSDRMAQAAQLSPASLLNCHFAEIFNCDGMGHGTSTVGHQLKTAIANHVPFRDLIICFKRDGISLWWSLSGKPLLNGSGGFAGPARTSRRKCKPKSVSRISRNMIF